MNRKSELIGARLPAPVGGRLLSLPNGRILAWSEFGDPTGRPLLYCHGTPGSRLEAGLAHGVAVKCGLRLLAVDRPGYGHSTAAPGRTARPGCDLGQALPHCRTCFPGMEGHFPLPRGQTERILSALDAAAAGSRPGVL